MRLKLLCGSTIINKLFTTQKSMSKFVSIYAYIYVLQHNIIIFNKSKTLIFLAVVHS